MSKHYLTIVIGVLFSLWAIDTSAIAASIHIPETNYDFGEVEEGTVVSHEFIVKNTGPDPLEIKEVRPG